MRLLFLLLIFLFPCLNYGQEEQTCNLQEEHFNILFIGNSYSLDASAYLPRLLVDMGVAENEYCVYCAVQAGASLDYWWKVYQQGAEIENLCQMGGTKLADHAWTLAELLHEPWDVVVLQQASALSNQLKSYRPYLQNMVDMLRRESAKPDVTIAFQLTWSKYFSADKGPYGTNGWRSIVETVQQISDEVGLTTIIPSGTVIQNLRRTDLNSSLYLTRDGVHLAYGVAQYAVALACYETLCRPLTGQSALDAPPSDAVKALQPDHKGVIPITDDNYKVIYECVRAAMANPYELISPDAVPSPQSAQRNAAPRQRSPIYDKNERMLRYRAPGINIVGGKKVFTPVRH